MDGPETTTSGRSGWSCDTVGEAVSARLSHSPDAISQIGTSMNPKNPAGVSDDAPITIVAQASGAGSIWLRRAPRPVARSRAAKAAFQPSQS